MNKLVVKNVAAGMMRGGKFIPFRRYPPDSPFAGQPVEDYDPKRAGETKKKKKETKKKKKKAKKTAAKKSSPPNRKPEAVKKKAAKKNPTLPVGKFMPARLNRDGTVSFLVVKKKKAIAKGR
jgi:hypothetical protein